MSIQTAHPAIELAMESNGTGVPVVFLHGLTFDRRTWRPIIDRLGDGVRSIAIDLPGHGDSPGAGMRLDKLADLIANNLEHACGVTDPIVVGHSMSGMLALTYASAHSVRGVVTVDQPWNVLSFAEAVRQSARALRGDVFSVAFAPFEQSIGVGQLAPAIRADVTARRRVQRELVLSYWAEVLDTAPGELQRRIEAYAASVNVPCLAVFGHELPAAERRHMTDLVPAVQITEWDGDGHLVHLAQPARFAARLSTFIDSCTTN